MMLIHHYKSQYYITQQLHKNYTHHKTQFTYRHPKVKIAMYFSSFNALYSLFFSIFALYLEVVRNQVFAINLSTTISSYYSRLIHRNSKIKILQ